jgi:hypothetical protein
MNIYVVECIEMFGIDYSTEYGTLGAFKEKKAALEKAKEEFEKFKTINANVMKEYEEDSDVYSDGTLILEEFDDVGNYTAMFGVGHDRSFINIFVEKCELN